MSVWNKLFAKLTGKEPVYAEYDDGKVIEAIPFETTRYAFIDNRYLE